MSSTTALLGLVLVLVRLAASLNPNCAPGGNFDLSVWTLQLPYADSSGQYAQVSSSQLAGCNGFQDPKHQYFFTETGDGAMVMKANGDHGNPDCVVIPGSQHCRTEFRESSPSAWPTTGSQNRLYAHLLGVSGTKVVIGQAFQANSTYMKPVAELYYKSTGDLVLGVSTAPAGADQATTLVANVPVGTNFTYELRYELGNLGIVINGGALQPIKTYFTAPQAYFKAGCYNQGNDTGDIHFFGLSRIHVA